MTWKRIQSLKSQLRMVEEKMGLNTAQLYICFFKSAYL